MQLCCLPLSGNWSYWKWWVWDYHPANKLIWPGEERAGTLAPPSWFCDLFTPHLRVDSFFLLSGTSWASLACRKGPGTNGYSLPFFPLLCFALLPLSWLSLGFTLSSFECNCTIHQHYWRKQLDTIGVGGISICKDKWYWAFYLIKGLNAHMLATHPDFQKSPRADSGGGFFFSFSYMIFTFCPHLWKLTASFSCMDMGPPADSGLQFLLQIYLLIPKLEL